jgi:hypothetical protein
MEGRKREWDLEGNDKRRRKGRTEGGVGGGGAIGRGWEGAGECEWRRKEGD